MSVICSEDCRPRGLVVELLTIVFEQLRILIESLRQVLTLLARQFALVEHRLGNQLPSLRHTLRQGCSSTFLVRSSGRCPELIAAVCRDHRPCPLTPCPRDRSTLLLRGGSFLTSVAQTCCCCSCSCSACFLGICGPDPGAPSLLVVLNGSDGKRD